MRQLGRQPAHHELLKQILYRTLGGADERILEGELHAATVAGRVIEVGDAASRQLPGTRSRRIAAAHLYCGCVRSPGVSGEVCFIGSKSIPNFGLSGVPLKWT